MWIPFLVTAFVVGAEVAISFNSVLLPNIKDHFMVSNQMAQATMSIGLFALGFSGIAYGGLCDAMGRRPLFIFSVCLFTLGSLACALATSIEQFMLFRFLQGVGAGAGWIVGNACLSDVYHGNRYVSIMNQVHAVAGITPAVAPVIGSLIAQYYGWKNCFYLLFVFSLLTAFLMIWLLPETLTHRRAFSTKVAIKNYRDLFRSSRFLYYLAIKAISVMLIFAEIANVPLIYVDYLGVAPNLYGLYVLPPFAAYIFSSILCNRYLDRYGVDKIMQAGIFTLVLGNLFTGVILLTVASPSAALLQFSRLPVYLAWGTLFGNATSQVVSSVKGHEGSASAMMISMEMLCSSLAISITSELFDTTMRPLVLFALLVSLVLYLSLYVLAPKVVSKKEA